MFYKLSLFSILLICADSDVLGMCSPHVTKTPDDAHIHSDRRACHPVKFGAKKPNNEVLGKCL